MTAASLGRVVVEHGIPVLQGVRDPDEIAELAARTTRPHTVLPRAAGTTLDTHLHAIATDGGIDFNRLIYGGDVTVVPGDYEPDSFLLPVSIAGAGALRYGRDRVPISAKDTTMIPPYREFQSDADADYDQVIVSIDRARFESAAASLQGEDDVPRFDPALTRFTLSEPVLRLLETTALASSNSGPLSDPRLQWKLHELVIESLLLSMPALREGDARIERPAPARVREAVRYMLDHLDEPLSVTGVAAHVGVKPRALQAAFRREYDTTPMTWLRTQRLERARGLLLNSDPRSTTVTSVARACGFLHLGEFASAFRARFGVTPSVVLRSR